MKFLLFLFFMPVFAYAWISPKYNIGDCLAYIVCDEMIDGNTNRVMDRPTCVVTDLEIQIDRADTIGYITHFRTKGYEQVKYKMSHDHVEM
jgi:hypothetical protein